MMILAINESNLNNLSTDSYQELRQSGFISPIYACLFSMGRIESLVRLKAAQQMYVSSRVETQLRQSL
jgi:hypothetical protein